MQTKQHTWALRIVSVYDELTEWIDLFCRTMYSMDMRELNSRIHLYS